MAIIEKRYTVKSLIVTLLGTAGFNTLIAMLLKVIYINSTFADDLISSQCIGLAICSCMIGVIHWVKVKSSGWQLVWMASALLIGTGCGLSVESLITGTTYFTEPQNSRYLFATLALAVGFGVGITYFFISRHWITQSEKNLQKERIRRLTMEKEMAETHLKLLQAQIEPHFLFNTLSTVISLLETDPSQAAMMLSDLTHFLRVSLERTRQQETTLGQELDVISAYLNLFKIRMGPRLTYRIAVPDEMRSEAFPPMLLQPLVENAIQHGLEPLVDGGDIVVGAKRLDRCLTVTVADTGTGLQHHDGERHGFGLTNIAERLKTVYGKNARLLLEDNQPSGLKVIIEVDH